MGEAWPPCPMGSAAEWLQIMELEIIFPMPDDSVRISPDLMEKYISEPDRQV